MVRRARIELASQVWKTRVLPLNDRRINNVAHREGLEPPTPASVAQCSDPTELPVQNETFWLILESNQGPTDYDSAALTYLS